MTDEEYERIKEAEKTRLRARKRHRDVLRRLKRRGALRNALQGMVTEVQRLLGEHDALVERLWADAAQKEARADLALEALDNDLRDADETRREERAAELVRRYKAAEQGRPSASADGASSDSGPEKTIGRMRDPRSGDDE